MQYNTEKIFTPTYADMKLLKFRLGKQSFGNVAEGKQIFFCFLLCFALLLYSHIQICVISMINEETNCRQP